VYGTVVPDGRCGAHYGHTQHSYIPSFPRQIGELYVDLTKDEADARLTATLEEKQAEAETLKVRACVSG
jgi:hypothetical protein